MQIAHNHGENCVIREPLKQLSDVGDPKWPFKAGLYLLQAFRKGQDVTSSRKFTISIFRQLLLCRRLAHARDSHYFVSAGFTAGYGNGGARNCKQIRKEFNHCPVGFALDWRRGKRQFQCVTHAPVMAFLRARGWTFTAKVIPLALSWTGIMQALAARRIWPCQRARRSILLR